MGSSANNDIVAFASFDLSDLPADVTIERASLKSEVEVVTGMPFAERGAIEVADVLYSLP